MKKPISPNALINEQKVILGVSIPLSLMLVTCSTIGLLYPSIYATSSPNWLTQTVAQDGVNLFLIAPIFIVAALYSYQGTKFAFLMWGGTVGYLVYTFLIYCFAVRFNSLFPIYCFVLGLSVFSAVWFISTQIKIPIVSKLNSKLILRIAGIYFIVISVGFYVLWLSEIIPAAVSNQAPRSLAETGLLTNPVQVLDLSILLPLIFIAGLMAINGKPFSAILIPVILIFFILMDVTIAALTIVLLQNGFGGSMMVAVAMGALTLFSLGLLIAYVRNTHDELSN